MTAWGSAIVPRGASTRRRYSGSSRIDSGSPDSFSVSVAFRPVSFALPRASALPRAATTGTVIL